MSYDHLWGRSFCLRQPLDVEGQHRKGDPKADHDDEHTAEKDEQAFADHVGHSILKTRVLPAANSYTSLLNPRRIGTGPWSRAHREGVAYQPHGATVMLHESPCIPRTEDWCHAPHTVRPKASPRDQEWYWGVE